MTLTFRCVRVQSACEWDHSALSVCSVHAPPTSAATHSTHTPRLRDRLPWCSHDSLLRTCCCKRSHSAAWRWCALLRGKVCAASGCKLLVGTAAHCIFFVLWRATDADQGCRENTPAPLLPSPSVIALFHLKCAVGSIVTQSVTRDTFRRE